MGKSDEGPRDGQPDSAKRTRPSAPVPTGEGLERLNKFADTYAKVAKTLWPFFRPRERCLLGLLARAAFVDPDTGALAFKFSPYGSRRCAPKAADFGKDLGLSSEQVYDQFAWMRGQGLVKTLPADTGEGMVIRPSGALAECLRPAGDEDAGVPAARQRSGEEKPEVWPAKGRGLPKTRHTSQQGEIAQNSPEAPAEVPGASEARHGRPGPNPSKSTNPTNPKPRSVHTHITRKDDPGRSLGGGGKPQASRADAHLVASGFRAALAEVAPQVRLPQGFPLEGHIPLFACAAARAGDLDLDQVGRALARVSLPVNGEVHHWLKRLVENRVLLVSEALAKRRAAAVVAEEVAK